jgi:hypothetical protein
MKILKIIFLLLIVAHLFLSAKEINKWFTRTVIPTARRTTGNPDKDIFITLNKTQAAFITLVKESVPDDAHFVWRDEIDPMVNFYIYPRRSYSSKDYEPGAERVFFHEHGITYIVRDFASMSLIPADKL